MSEAYLFRVSLEHASGYSWQTPPKPLYVVQRNKDLSREYAEKHLERDYKIKSISCLAKQLGGCMFSGDL